MIAARLFRWNDGILGRAFVDQIKKLLTDERYESSYSPFFPIYWRIQPFDK